MTELFIFIGGALFGGFFGMLTMAICAAAGREDRFREEQERRTSDED